MSDKIDRKKCFIIMPITTPKHLVDAYGGDANHFEHVLEHLFIPAVEAAGMEPVRPVATGSEIIHARIVKHVEETDFLLCDMSTLNPNVFFELGIRTAVNKAVALVKDEVTGAVPYDTLVLNFQSYRSGLRGWELKEDVPALTAHLEACLESGETGNSLWRHFSISSQMAPLEEHSGVDAKIDFLAKKLDGVIRELLNSRVAAVRADEAMLRAMGGLNISPESATFVNRSFSGGLYSLGQMAFMRDLKRAFGEGLTDRIEFCPGGIKVQLPKGLYFDDEILRSIAKKHGLEVTLVQREEGQD